MTSPHTDDVGESLQANDKCPKWAEELIHRLRDLEIRLGNLRPDDMPWQTMTADDLARRARLENDQDSAHGEQDASLAESIFERLCRGLSEEGFDSGEICSMVNARLHSERLPYCNAEEVEEALGDGEF